MSLCCGAQARLPADRSGYVRGRGVLPGEQVVATGERHDPMQAAAPSSLRPRAGRIPHHRLGHYVRFSADDLKLWLRENRSGDWAARRL
jgi:hypothetical protein